MVIPSSASKLKLVDSQPLIELIDLKKEHVSVVSLVRHHLQK